MLVDESHDHLQVTTGTLKRERSVSSLIHCNCGYKQIVDTQRMLTVSAHTFGVTLMFLSKILDHFPMSTFVGKREWSVTSLVGWLCMWKTTINNVTALINTYYLDQHAC